MKQREQAAREATAMVYGTPGYATMTQPEKDKVNEAVLKKVALKYDVYPEMVAEAVVETLQADEAAEAAELARLEEIKNSKWLTFYWNKWRPLPFVVRFAITFAAISIFPPLTMAVVVWLFLVYYRFKQENPNHWTDGVVDTAGKIAIAGVVYGEYKKFRDGPKK